MNKFPCLTLTIWLSAIALMPTASYSQTRSRVEPASTKLPVKIDVPLCYLQTPNGRLIDLSQTCGFVQPNICALSSSDPERASTLASFCQQNQQCLLTETCDQTPNPKTPTKPNGPVGSLTSDRLLSST
jgi:hypothetical protein